MAIHKKHYEAIPKVSKFMQDIHRDRKDCKIPIRDMARLCQMPIQRYSQFEQGYAKPNFVQRAIIKNVIECKKIFRKLKNEENDR